MNHRANVTIVGNLINDCTNAQSNNQTRVNFAVGVRTSRKPDGAKYYENDIYNCTMWGPRAERLIQSLKKGALVMVSGAMEMHKWTDRNGSAVTNPSIEVNGAEVLLAPRTGNNGGGYNQTRTTDMDTGAESDPF